MNKNVPHSIHGHTLLNPEWAERRLLPFRTFYAARGGCGFSPLTPRLLDAARLCYPGLNFSFHELYPSWDSLIPQVSSWSIHHSLFTKPILAPPEKTLIAQVKEIDSWSKPMKFSIESSAHQINSAPVSSRRRLMTSPLVLFRNAALCTTMRKNLF